MNTPSILLLGGYGAVGRRMAKLILQETPVSLVIAGRRLAEAEACCQALRSEFSDRPIEARYADVYDVISMQKAFKGVDLVMVLTTTPTSIEQIAQTALACSCNYLDILVTSSVWTDLQALAPKIAEKGKIFISQAGFHPGMLAVMTRLGARYFDRYDEACLSMAMETALERPEQVAEIIPLITHFDSWLYENGAWRKATYRDAIKVDVGGKFGQMQLYPFWMEELRSMPTLLGLKKVGLYISGFNWLVDNFIMPLIILIDWLGGKRFQKLSERVFYWGVKKFAPDTEGVVMLNDAKGLKNNQLHKVRLRLEHPDAYLFTIIPVVACLKQILGGKLPTGLHMMGHVCDLDRLMQDMEVMGLRFVVKEG